MPEIKDITTGKKIECNSGENLLAVLQKNKVYVNNACNGKGTCGKCKVKVLNGDVSEMSEAERKMLTSSEIESGIRLSCMVEALGDIEIQIENDTTAMSVLMSGYIPDFEKDSNLTGYGVAIDIGTTTVALSLVELSTGKIIAESSCMNAQRAYGQDVLTRITYEIEEGDKGIADLKKAIIDSINAEVNKLCATNNIDVNEIISYSIAGNCTMTHMVLGVDARAIGKAPYKPIFLDSQTRNAVDSGFVGSKDATLYTLPQVSGYIGGDILAGAYVCDLKNKKGNSFFLDIGTNGEMVLSGNGKMVSCSCAAGPALEGMNITCGMPALPGAIDSVVIDKEEGKAKITIIGNEAPKGICGSGILEVMSELIRNELVKPTGAFVKSSKLSEDDKRRDLLIEDESGSGCRLAETVSVTQKDVRQIQLAKGAILSGFRTLVNKCNMEDKDIDEVIIAGQFGSHLSAKALTGSGLLPKDLENKIEYVGNTSKTGAYMALMSGKVRSEMEKLAKEIEYFELAESENYEQLFVECMRF